MDSIYGKSGACVIHSSYWESRLPWQNRLWLTTDQTDHHGRCGLSLNTPLDAINPDALSLRLHLLSSDAGGGWSAAWTLQRINHQLVLQGSGLMWESVSFSLNAGFCFSNLQTALLNDANLKFWFYFC